MGTTITVTVHQEGTFEGRPIVNYADVSLDFPSDELMELKSLREKIQRAANAAKARFDDEVDD